MWRRELQSDNVGCWQEFVGDDLFAMLQVHVYCAYRSRLGPSWTCEGASDLRGRLYYVTSGTGAVSHHGKAYPLRPGRLYLIPSGVQHSHRCARRLELYWCHFAVRLRSGVDLFTQMSLPYELLPPKEERTDERFAELVRLCQDDSLGSVLRRSGMLMQLLAPFLDRADLSGWNRWHSSAAVFMPALREMEERVAERLLIPQLAALVRMSPSCFAKRFKQVFGLAPHQYQLEKRIGAAQVMLAQSDDKLMTIGTHLGFTDAFHFSRAFKKLTGTTPSRYRELIRCP